ncbi:MAG: tRNA pseudouridine(55) synthase TruB [Gemmataceae bacterium]|nr:tRNA pseudouridine(55) synthase TruB [Gemmataceae bacterium]
MKTPPPHGLLVLDKPGGMTSRDAVDRAQRWFPRGTRVGHTGTLDPLATGVLVLCVGAATRLTEYVQRMAKIYRAGVRLGARSDTDDADGAVTPVTDATPPDLDAVRHCLDGFRGPITQVPPAYSAVKVTGRRAHELARRGQEVDLQPRTVEVHGIDILDYAWPRLEVEVYCGKGTYIRSLARDLGERLGCGGLIETLRRTRVGPFDAADAVHLDVPPAEALACLRPVAQAVADLPRLALGAADARRLAQGQVVRVGPQVLRVARDAGAVEAAVFGPGEAFVGVARIDAAHGTLAPAKVMPASRSG